MTQKVYLNDLGIINAIGTDKLSVAKNLLSNNTGLTTKKKLLSGRETWVGVVDAKLPAIPRSLAEYDCRNNRMMLHACLQILPAIDKAITKYGKNRIGVVLGTSTSGIDNGEIACIEKLQYGSFPESFDYKQQETGGMSEFIKSYFDLENVAYTISTACSSSGKAFASAQRLIDADICDAVIVGGCDTLCELTLNGFDCLEAVSQNLCKPFDVTRDGINIGEGAAVFLVSREPSDIELLGVGESSDGHHITAPEPNGRGAIQAMNQALELSKLEPSDIGYLNMHGTATPLNDAMESQAAKSVFDMAVPCSSTKSLTGHTLGAAAATEIGLCWLLLSDKYNPHKKLPKQSNNIENIIENIGIITQDVYYKKSKFMSNSFAFGGSNVSIIVARS